MIKHISDIDEEAAATRHVCFWESTRNNKSKREWFSLMLILLKAKTVSFRPTRSDRR